MKIALCTTTINVPHVLKLYRACGPDVKFFVALDKKSASIPVETDPELPANCMWFTPGSQEGWKCSSLIGWNSIQRRNIAFLEALAWGADVIVSIDDDNIPLDAAYFNNHQNAFQPFHGVMASNVNEEHNWFDVGSLLTPPSKHRGYPHNLSRPRAVTHAVGAKVGVNAGICLGDPDIDASTRIAVAPDVQQTSLLLQAGLLVNPHTWTVFNSQNTAVLRELIPAWGMIPFTGRMDDIYASLICQRVMRERNLHVRFGKPFVYQQRNEHNLVKDLRGEIDGYENVARLADLLDHIVLAGKSVIDDCRAIWSMLNHVDWMAPRAVSAMMAYIDDAETAL